MQHVKTIAIVGMAAALVTACSNPEPAREPVPTRDEAAEAHRERSDAVVRFEERVADLDRRWEAHASRADQATAGLRTEVQEDLKNVRQAVTDLKTTTPENWWERHERAMARTADDIEQDVRRLAKGQKFSVDARSAETPVQALPFESRRDQFVTQLRARVDAMGAALKDVRARGAQQTELEDTRARLAKLSEDVDRLRRASADDWWDISSSRVSEYIDRLDESIGRLDDDKK